VAGVIGLAALLAIFGGSNTPTPKASADSLKAAALSAMTPVERAQVAAKQAATASAAAAAKAIQEAEFQHAVSIARALKAGMKNPSSFELGSVARMPSGALCFEYRGTNSFNAVVPGYAIEPPTGKLLAGDERATAAAWNKHCAGKTGQDLGSIKFAM
jgi:hypothetical protein